MGELFLNKLVETEDNMNCLIGNITVKYRDGRTAHSSAQIRNYAKHK